MTTLQLAGDPRRTDDRADAFADVVGVALRRVAYATARGVSPVPSELDLARVRAVWRQQVEDELLPVVEREWRRAADATWKAVTDGLRGPDAVTAAVDADAPRVAVSTDPDRFVIPKIPIEAARTYLETAQNRLVGVGDLLWEKMREELVSGLSAGEGSADVARRLRATADLTRPRATVIARTEVIGATNRGAYAQVLATGMTGTKTWLATNDKRTRPSHRAVNGTAVDLAGTFDVGGEPPMTNSLKSEETFAQQPVVSANGVSVLGRQVADVGGKDFVAQFTKAERAAQLAYADPATFFKIRDAYRAGEPYLLPDGTNVFDALSSSTAKTQLDNDTTLWRAMKLKKDVVEELVPSATIEHDFFASLTSVPNDAKSYGAAKGVRGTQDVVLQVLTPGGTRVFTGMPNEYVLPAGSKMKVRRTFDVDRRRYVVVDLEPS